MFCLWGNTTYYQFSLTSREWWLRSVTMLNFMNFWFIVYGLPQCYAQDDSNTCMPWLCPNLHVCHAVAHLGLQFYNFYAEMWDWDDDYNRCELNLNLNLTEMVQAGLSFSLAEVRKWMVHMLCPREWQTLCALMAWIFSRGDGFFHVSLPGTVAGNLHLLKRLCLPKYLWDYQEWRKILGCSILCLQHVTSISFSGLFNSQAVSGFLGIKGSAVLSNQHWKFNTSLKVRTVIWVKRSNPKDQYHSREEPDNSKEDVWVIWSNFSLSFKNTFS